MLDEVKKNLALTTGSVLGDGDDANDKGTVFKKKKAADIVAFIESKEEAGDDAEMPHRCSALGFVGRPKSLTRCVETSLSGG